MNLTDRNGLEHRIAADIARDLIDLHEQADTPTRVKRQLRVELRRLEPVVAAAATCGDLPFARRGTGYSLRAIRTALGEIEAQAAFLAD